MTIKPPGVKVRLEYPRQTIPNLNDNDLYNFALLNYIVTMKYITNFINSHFNELTSVKNLFIMFLLFIIVVLSIGIKNTNNRIVIARQYINDLEKVIESDGTVIGDVCGTDSYSEYYNY